MLVLARKCGETILVGDIEFKIVAIKGGKVRVGVTAPIESPILRGELLPDQQTLSSNSLDKTGA